jgi:hypothetical protein
VLKVRLRFRKRVASPLQMLVLGHGLDERLFLALESLGP